MIFIVGGAYQGKLDYVLENYPKHTKIVKGYHSRVKEQLEEKKDPLQEAKKLIEELTQGGEFIIISDEVGCGLVPMDAFERKYREQTGRVNCYLAKQAEQVIRVICGIGTRIK